MYTVKPIKSITVQYSKYTVTISSKLLVNLVLIEISAEIIRQIQLSFG